MLVHILATLPVSIASAKYSVSTLKRLKLYLRNITNLEHLTGLALLNIHREVVVEPIEIVNRLAYVEIYLIYYYNNWTIYNFKKMNFFMSLDIFEMFIPWHLYFQRVI